MGGPSRLEAADFVRVRPSPGASLAARPRRGQREVLHRRGEFVDTVADADLRRELARGGYRVEVLQEDLTGALERIQRPDAAEYHRHEELVAELASWEEQFPDLVRVVRLGAGAEVLPGGERREILAARIGGSGDAAKPGLLLFGGVHAREFATSEVLLLAGRQLLRDARTEPGLRELLASRELWLVPCLNPDGREYCFTRDPWWRKSRGRPGNGSSDPRMIGVDLNRNFSYEWGTNAPRGGSSGLPSSGIYRGPRPFSEPESRALRDLVRSRSFSLSVSLHSYGEMILLPYGFENRPPEHEALYHDLGVRLVGITGYQLGTVHEVLGYYSNGRHDDWLYADRSQGKGMVGALELEIGRSFFPRWPVVREDASRIHRVMRELLPMAGSELRLRVAVDWDASGHPELELVVSNHGVRDAREVTLRVDRVPPDRHPLVWRQLDDLSGLGDADRPRPSSRRLRVPLFFRPRTVRVSVRAAGEQPVVEEVAVPAVD